MTFIMSSSGLLAPALMNCFWLEVTINHLQWMPSCIIKRQPWYTWTFPLLVPVQAAFSLLSCLELKYLEVSHWVQRRAQPSDTYFLFVQIKLGYYKLISSVLILCLFSCTTTTPSKSTLKFWEELRVYSSRWPITRRWKKPPLDARLET